MKIKLTTMKFKCIKEKTITIDLDEQGKAISEELYIEFPLKEFNKRLYDHMEYRLLVDALKVTGWS